MQLTRQYKLMQSKIHKAKLITLHNKIIDPETIQQQQSPPAAIHAYMGLLRHLINKNQTSLKNQLESTSSVGRFKVAASISKKKTDRSNLTPFPRDSPSRKLSRKQGCLNRQEILHNIMQSNRRLIEIKTFTRAGYGSRGNQSERMGRHIEQEYRSFVPIGKIYHQLKHKTETAVQYEIKPHMNSSANLKLSSDKVEERKRFSIYAKQTRSAQRNAFRQGRTGVEQPMELSAVALLQPAVEGPPTRSHSPTPW